MKYLLLLFVLTNYIAQNVESKERYHTLEFTSSEPKIKERCVSFDKIKKFGYGYVKETVDSSNRCIKLEFFKKPGVYFTAIDLPSIVKYVWTDSSVIEFLYNKNGGLLTVDGKFVRPNKIEYILNGSIVIKIKKFFNDKFLTASIVVDGCSLYDATFFLMYSGCNVKYNKKYRVKF